MQIAEYSISIRFNWIRLISLLLLTIATSLEAQVVQTARYELQAAGDGSEYKIIPWNDNGLMIYRRVETPITDDILYFIKLDTTLLEQWVTSINVSKQLSLVFAKGHRATAYFLFKPRNAFGDFQLFLLGQDSATNKVITIKNVIPFNPIMFEVGQKSVVIAGYYNYRPMAIHCSLETGQSKLLPGFFNEPGELNQLTIQPDETIDVVINTRNAEKRLGLSVMNFASDGSALKTTIIQPSVGRNLLFGRSVSLSGDSTVIAGVYGKGQEYSRGIFVASVDPAGEYTVRYYNFADLKNFFKYLKNSRQDRIQDRIERKRTKGKKPRFNYRIAVHQFVPYKDHYLLLGEAFYPVYKSNGYTSTRTSQYYYNRYSIANNNWQRDFTFDGYRYTHAVTLGIAKDGRLLWDNSFEIRDVKSYTLYQHVHILQGDNLAMFYSHNNKIYTKIIEGTQVITPKNEEAIKGKFEADRIKRNSSGEHQLVYWYGKYLLSYGEQDLQNLATPNVALNRRVFYINKFTYRE